MKKLILLVLFISNGYCFAQSNQEQISSIVSKQESDWNKNDMNSYASAFSENGVLINFLGLIWKGRTEIINQFNLINDCCIKPTQIKLDITNTKFLSDTAAVVYIKEALTAKEDYNVPGKVIAKGSVDHKVITMVVVKQKDAWKILSMQVTQMVSLPPPLQSTPPIPK